MRPQHDGWLDQLNRALGEASVSTVHASATGRCLIVTGPPRTGTTLMLQALQSYLPATVIDHLSASFWGQPDIGVRLSDHLRSRTEANSLTPSFSSTWGLTPNWYEPHEFSYFWRDSLGWTSTHEEPSPEQIDRTDFAIAARLLEQAACATQHPLATKGFPLLWCGIEFLAASEKSAVIVMTRDGDSLHKSISSGWAAADSWFSLKPLGWRDFVDRPTKDKIDYQVERLVAASNRLISTDHPRVYEVSLEALASDQEATVKQLHAEFRRRSFIE